MPPGLDTFPKSHVFVFFSQVQLCFSFLIHLCLLHLFILPIPLLPFQYSITMEKNRKLSDAEAQHLEANQSDSSSGHEDAVFGKITEGGPNYRNVCLSLLPPFPRKLTTPGWLGWHRRPHDEDPDRSRRPVLSCRIQRPRPHPRNHLSPHCRNHHHLVRIHGGRVQNQPS